MVSNKNKKRIKITITHRKMYILSHLNKLNYIIYFKKRNISDIFVLYQLFKLG